MTFKSLFLQIVSLAVIVTLISSCSAQAPVRAQFQNNHISHPNKNFFSFLNMRLFGDVEWADHAELAKSIPVEPVNIDNILNPTSTAQVTWIGHSTFLLQVNGLNILTDPIFAERASPVSFAGPKRLVALPIELDELPKIDAVVISHNHYDHLDEFTIKSLGETPHYYVPEGLSAWFEEQGISADKVTELAWWENARVADGLVVTAMPSQHWSSRSLFDRHLTHWASWHLQFDNLSMWFAGDTGYNNVDFKEIGERTGGVDFAMIPIGAWKPRSFMSAYHVNEAEAVQIHKDINAKQSVGMHWGTFPLTAEGPDEPRRNLATLASELKGSQFDTMVHGTTRTLLP